MLDGRNELFGMDNAIFLLIINNSIQYLTSDNLAAGSKKKNFCSSKPKPDFAAL
jgi:hypothetical protein